MKRLTKLISLSILFVLAINICSFAANAPSQNENYPYVYDLRWDGKTAKWSKYGKISKYEVVLYTDNMIGDIKTTSSNSHNFSSNLIDGDHKYYFKVRAYNTSTGWSVWEQSPDINFVKSGSKVNNYVADPMNPIGSSSGNIYNSTVNAERQELFSNPPGVWIKNNGFWFFQLMDNTFATSKWINSNGIWYYVNDYGAMVTGLLNINGKTYYFNESGAMMIGEITIGNQKHLFGFDGAMIY